jgi:hypothetical protein
MSMTAQPRKRGLLTLHRIPAVKLLGVILLEVAIPVRPMVRKLTGPPAKPHRTSVWILPPAPGTAAPMTELPDRSVAC